MHRFLSAKKWICLLALLFAIPAQAVTIDKMVVFGDSLSDVGNMYGLSAMLIPKEPPYYQGRFSDGPIWIEYVAQALHIKTTSKRQFEDYAYAGSWTEPPHISQQTLPDLAYQIDCYINQDSYCLMAPSLSSFWWPSWSDTPENHLFVIWSGSNDYLGGRNDIEAATTNTVKIIGEQIEKLIAHGAKHFLVPNLSDLGLTPQVMAEGPEHAARATALSHRHNEKLAAKLAQIQQDHPDVNLISLDIMSYFTQIMVNPQQFGIKNVSEACYRGGFYLSSPKPLYVNNTDVRKNVDLLDAANVAYSLNEDDACLDGNKVSEFLYFDRLHPTGKIHRLLADYALETLKKNGIAAG